MNLIFFGPPGSGKGTYASRVAEKLGIQHVSTGQMFRNAMRDHAPLGTLITSNMKKGILIGDDITNSLVKDKLAKIKTGYILDGYPRTMNQGEFLEKIAKIDAVVNFVLDEKLIIKKTLGRRTCSQCGETYNIANIKVGKINMPALLPKVSGKCDKCGGKIVQRTDDNEKTIKERIKTYHKQSEPLLKHYRKQKLVLDISVIGPPDVMVDIILKELKRWTP